MANYSKIVDYAAKDALNTGDPLKLIKGTEIGAEYDAIATAIATKANTASPAFTGVSGFAVGAVGAPSIYMTGYATTGWYNIGANNWGFAVSGAKVLDIATTGLSVTGTLSATGDVTASGGNLLLSSGGTIPLRISGATTGSSVARIQNAGGDAIFGQENSVGNNLIVGCSAYDTIIRGPSGLAFSANAGAGMQMRLSSTGLAVTGTLSATGTSTLARIDQSNGSINFASLGNGSTSWQIGTQTAGKPLDIFIGGAVIAQFSDTGLAVTGAISATTTIKTGGYTVATLPAGTVGMRAYVTDATAPTYNGALTGGGAVTVPVFYNGTAWVSA